MWPHHVAFLAFRTSPDNPSGNQNRGARHDHHRHQAHRRGRVAARSRRRHLHRRPDRPPATWTPPRSRPPRGSSRSTVKVLMAVARARRHHRHVPHQSRKVGLSASSASCCSASATCSSWQRVHVRLRPPDAGRHRPGLRQRLWSPPRTAGRGRHRPDADRLDLPASATWSAASSSGSPCSEPASWRAGRGPARRGHRRDRPAGRAAGFVQPAVGRPGRHRADRARRLPVAHPGTLRGWQTVASAHASRPGPMTTQPATAPTRERRGRSELWSWPVPAALFALPPSRSSPARSVWYSSPGGPTCCRPTTGSPASRARSSSTSSAPSCSRSSGCSSSSPGSAGITGPGTAGRAGLSPSPGSPWPGRRCG